LLELYLCELPANDCLWAHRDLPV